MPIAIVLQRARAVETIQLGQQANLATRQAKHEPRSLAEQRASWRTEAAAVLGSDDAVDAVTGATAGRRSRDFTALTIPNQAEHCTNGPEESDPAVAGARDRQSLRVSTPRYNKLAFTYRGGVGLRDITIWLRQ